MKRTRLLILLIILMAAAATITVFYAQNKNVVGTLTIPMDVKVEDHYAFNLDSDAIHFGKVVPTQQGIRGFILNNTFSFPVTAEFRFSGHIAPWVAPDVNLILLNPRETRELNLTVTIPDNTPYATYTGTMHVTFRKYSS